MVKIELNTRQRDILDKRREKMIVAVCSTNPAVNNIISGKEGIDVFFLDNLNDVAIPEYDLVLVDLELCNGNLDVDKLQSKRTVFFVTELNSATVDKLLYNFGVGEHLYYYTSQGAGLKKNLTLKIGLSFFICLFIIRKYNHRNRIIVWCKSLTKQNK